MLSSIVDFWVNQFKKPQKLGLFKQALTVILVIYVFLKANLTEEDTNEIFQWLSNTPKWTTIRVNTLNKSLGNALKAVQSYVENVNFKQDD